MSYHHQSKYLLSAIVLLGAPLFSSPLNAAPLSAWDSSWTQFANDDGYTSNGYVNPGWGGQAFDAEYLYYKRTGNTLSIGLQTGFDLSDGRQQYGSDWYFAGDLALSFDGDTSGSGGSGYEYGVDFGLLTKDYSAHHKALGDATGRVDMGSGNGIDPAGLYRNVGWNNGVYSHFHVSDPFAMDAGTLVTGAGFSQSTGSGMAGGETSYYRSVSFDLTALGLDLTQPIDLDAHWTMSCGNDAIDGHASVPEPGALILMASGLFGLVGIRRLRRKA